MKQAVVARGPAGSQSEGAPGRGQGSRWAAVGLQRSPILSWHLSRMGLGVQAASPRGPGAAGCTAQGPVA